MVTTLHLNDILDYVTCPLKLSLKDKPNSKLSAEELYCLSAKEGLSAFFSSMGIGKTYKTSFNYAASKFGEMWASNIHRLEYKGKKSHLVYEGQLLFTRVNTIFDEDKDEIVSVNFPLKLALSPELIVEDTIDLLLIHREYGFYGKTTYRAISYAEPYPFDNQRYIDVKASFFKLALQRHIRRDTYKSYSYEIRPLMGSDRTIVPDINQYHLINKLCTDISKAIKLGINYPTNNKEACKYCGYNKMCELSLIK